MPVPDLSETLYTAVLSDVLDSLGYRQQAISDTVIARALKKIGSENITRTELQAGATLAEAFTRHGTL